MALAGGLTMLLAAITIATQSLASAALPLGFMLLFILMAMVEVKRRQLLIHGEPVFGRAIDVTMSRGSLVIRYEYSTNGRTFTGNTGLDIGLTTRRFGRRIVAGDSLIIIYDGARPSRSVIWGLAAKSLPDKSVPPASARSKRRLGSTVATFGIALIVLVGGPLISKVRRDVPSSVVTKCDARHSHVYYFDLTTDRGETFTVSSQDLPDWKSCLPAGTVLEKRAGEAGWRMDGTYRSPEQPTFAITIVLFSLGMLLVPTGLLLRRQ